jgi:hypothetical protein
MTVIPIFSVQFQHVLTVIPTDILQSSNMYSKIIAIATAVKNLGQLDPLIMLQMMYHDRCN